MSLAFSPFICIAVLLLPPPDLHPHHCQVREQRQNFAWQPREDPAPVGAPPQLHPSHLGRPSPRGVVTHHLVVLISTSAEDRCLRYCPGSDLQDFTPAAVFHF